MIMTVIVAHSTMIISITMIKIMMIIKFMIMTMMAAHSTGSDSGDKIPRDLAVGHNHHWDAQHLIFGVVILTVTVIVTVHTSTSQTDILQVVPTLKAII